MQRHRRTRIADRLTKIAARARFLQVDNIGDDPASLAREATDEERAQYLADQRQVGAKYTAWRRGI